MDYSTVSQACKKFEKRMQKDKNSLSEIKTIEEDLRRGNVKC